MKKFLSVMLAAVLLCLCGCSTAPKSEKISVVAAIFPEYDWVRQIVGDSTGVEIQLLCDDGVDPHSFQPTAADMVAVANADLLIFGGGESDGWLKKAMSDKKDQIVLELLPMLGEKAHAEEIVEGMQTEHDDEAEEEEEIDEHVWLSLSNAAAFCDAITDALCELDPQNQATYQANCQRYTRQLMELDEGYRQTVEAAQRDTILVCDRFPFRYLTEDYGIRYYAAFPGCSAECDASFETVIYLAEQVKQLQLDTILVTETSDGRIARSVAENSGVEDIHILTMDAMQSVPLKDAAVRSYLDTMEQNRQVLASALG